MGRLPTCYSPVRHSMPKHCVRLACIRHAASVHPEPGSNSPLSFSIFRQFHVFLTLSFSIFIDVFTVQFSNVPVPSRRVLIYNTIYPLPLQVFFYFFRFLFNPLFSLFITSLIILCHFSFSLKNVKLGPSIK